MKYEKALEFEANEEFVYLRFVDGTSLLMDRRRAEEDIARTAADHIAMDDFAYNDPFGYVRLMLYGDPSAWLEKNRK